jgi:hypothetical protein
MRNKSKKMRDRNEKQELIIRVKNKKQIIEVRF